ncbi:MAG: Asp-tRNA(Asn) amidotransferase GatCAB subunit C [Candidatus Altiarchaeales archaeon ex4484_43]|nr:MAG: Asp-tRNA(Asn) amidotransferase GatCAB subunit C [Candidatus Altiarchaeales archaeon ex4484_43]
MTYVLFIQSNYSKMLDEKKIREQGIKLIEEFSRMLEKIPETRETHYVVDLRNVTREDRRAVRKKGFDEKMKRIAPRWDEGYIVAEKAV